mgnify:CR=1 FL=1
MTSELKSYIYHIFNKHQNSKLVERYLIINQIPLIFSPEELADLGLTVRQIKDIRKKRDKYYETILKATDVLRDKGIPHIFIKAFRNYEYYDGNLDILISGHDKDLVLRLFTQ